MAGICPVRSGVRAAAGGRRRGDCGRPRGHGRLARRAPCDGGAPESMATALHAATTATSVILTNADDAGAAGIAASQAT
ncbi:hypothetical protein I547_0952 [Mycobacterium kansasii 824]|uniref:Uncharacterized protein n=1 Tax=Mycobacterium kansasii TaxID=1768 RepID=A0A1V3XVK9_MYCKA|nr:hypothetical protein I547_0952 [Mycobacterium kansasii 824]OOK83259.1 hypothetical protein BZL29_0479 [Mycobacterium kansasii]